MSPIELPRFQHGLTLIELIVFIVIVGAALAGVLSVFNVTMRHSADPLVRKQALAVAESLLEEIEARPFNCPPDASCVPVTVANRAQTHAVGDYAGFAMNGISGIDGAAIPALATYNAVVAVAAVALNGAHGMEIVVTVTNGPESVVVTGWRGAY